MHELMHTDLFGALQDPQGDQDFTSTGPVVDRVNVYRNELDLNPIAARPARFGLRLHYRGHNSGNSSYVRFGYSQKNTNGVVKEKTKRVKGKRMN